MKLQVRSDFPSTCTKLSTHWLLDVPFPLSVSGVLSRFCVLSYVLASTGWSPEVAVAWPHQMPSARHNSVLYAHLAHECPVCATVKPFDDCGLHEELRPIRQQRKLSQFCDSDVLPRRESDIMMIIAFSEAMAFFIEHHLLPLGTWTLRRTSSLLEKP